MNPLFGFTIGGLMMLFVVIIVVFSFIGTFVSPTSEKSIFKNVNSALNLNDPQMCVNFNDYQNCVSNIAYMEKNPKLCVAFIDDEKNQYDCLSKFFQKYKEKICDYVGEKYHADCIEQAGNYYK
ncbi:MAG: hypothetical protein K8Q89_01945 [Nitrosarchaeum sp.]|nr:hypothetical protein [Nitrosarchaeum sp.]